MNTHLERQITLAYIFNKSKSFFSNKKKKVNLSKVVISISVEFGRRAVEQLTSLDVVSYTHTQALHQSVLQKYINVACVTLHTINKCHVKSAKQWLQCNKISSPMTTQKWRESVEVLLLDWISHFNNFNFHISFTFF